MKIRNPFLLIAGLINLFTALLHLIAGQMDLVDPLLGTDLPADIQAQWLGVWHMVTFLLFASTWVLLRNSFQVREGAASLPKGVGTLYIWLSVPFLILSITEGMLVPQWILLLPIGGLAWLGVRRK